jgi:Na+/proline symporter
VNSASDVNHQLRWIVAIVFTMCLVMATERVVTIEWSFAYCNDPQDGPASAVFGVPFPYERWSGASSLAYNFVPHFYVLNLLVLFGIALPIVRRTAEHLARRSPRTAYRAIAVCGVLLCALVTGRHALVLATGLWDPVASIEKPPYDSYDALRPVGVSFDRHYDCTPSKFWFPAKWHAPSRTVAALPNKP